jgi:hypothetical protein
MFENKPKRKRGSRSPSVLYTPGFSMNEMEFRDDIQGIKKERKAWLCYATAKAAAQRAIIEADEARELAERIAAANRIVAQDLISLKAMELEEKMKAVELADREEARAVFSKYAEQVSAKFKAAVKSEGEWLEQVKRRIRKIESDIDRSAIRADRQELLRRGVIRGRRLNHC